MAKKSDKWVVTKSLLPGDIVSQLMSTEEHLPSDEMKITGEIFGIPLTYTRDTVMSEDSFSVVHYRYAIFTDHWRLKMVLDPDNHSVRAKEDFVWDGSGDFERWQKDASLIKLSLSAH